MSEHGASLSLLEYGILAWGGSSSATLEPLAVFQRALTKAVIYYMKTAKNNIKNEIKIFILK